MDIVAFVIKMIEDGQDVDLSRLTDEYFIRKLNAIKQIVPDNLIDELQVWKQAYEVIRKRVTRLCELGMLEKVSDGGRTFLIGIPEQEEYSIPPFEKIIDWMIMDPEYKKFIPMLRGGTNTGGGYHYHFKKFYTAMQKYLLAVGNN